MDVETIEEEIVYIETSIFGNVGLAAYSEPQKRPTHTASQARSSNVLSFASDQQGIGSYKRSMEATKDEELTICLGTAICHRAFVMAGFQRGVRNPQIQIDLWFARFTGLIWALLCVMEWTQPLWGRTP